MVTVIRIRTGISVGLQVLCFISVSPPPAEIL